MSTVTGTGYRRGSRIRKVHLYDEIEWYRERPFVSIRRRVVFIGGEDELQKVQKDPGS